MLNKPPLYRTLEKRHETANLRWPLRIQSIHLDSLAIRLNTAFSPYILVLGPNDPAAYALEWQAVNTQPDRHRGYALQWFAFALTLLILFVALNRGDHPL